MQLHSWGSGPLVSDEEETNSLLFIPEAGQALPLATPYIALMSCAVSSGSTFPNRVCLCRRWELRAHRAQPHA